MGAAMKRGAVSYNVRVAGVNEHVTIAVAYHLERPFVTFVPGAVQKRKIEAGRGEVRIAVSQVQRVPERCRMSGGRR